MDRLTLLTTRQATSVLVEAFARDPMMTYLVGDDPAEGSRAIRTRLVSWLAHYHQLAGHDTWGWEVEGRLVGSALVEHRSSGLRQLSALIQSAPLALRLPLPLLRRLYRYGELSDRGRPKGTSHFIVLFGVLQFAQGQGHGSRFLSAMHDHYGPKSCWALDTENPANLKFYEQLGYRRGPDAPLGPLTMFRLNRGPMLEE
jgi:GNAT superfamily N-acetyltransferase